MARWHGFNRETVEDCRILSIFKLRESGFFDAPLRMPWTTSWKNHTGEVVFRVHYSPQYDCERGLRVCIQYNRFNRHTDRSEKVEFDVRVVLTPCYFGGYRHWFICPLVTNGVACRRRVAKLYLPSFSMYFGCRHCHDLTYRSQKEHNSRIEAILKNPMAYLPLLSKGKLSDLLLAELALFRLNGRT